MRLIQARIQKYRSIRDTGWFDIETAKTILVGPNEAGKSAILQALQRLNRPADAKGFDPLRDYPRSEYNDITTKRVSPEEITVVTGRFSLEPQDQDLLPDKYKSVLYRLGRKLDGNYWHDLEDAPKLASFGEIKNDLLRLAAFMDSQVPPPPEGKPAPPKPSEKLSQIVQDWSPVHILDEARSKLLKAWLETHIGLIPEDNEKESARHNDLLALCEENATRMSVLETLYKRLPVFVLFSDYFRVRPLIHLDHLAQRVESKVLDDEQYDYGNQCLLKLLGFSARELSNLGRASEPAANNPSALQKYRDQLDKRSYQLNAASVKLTDEICSVWVPNAKKGEADRLRVVADGQYLKVVVEDSLGVEIELDQRSEGFQWLVSFFVVFFAEAAGKHANAILLLDEPGLHLHGLKQREFRETISRLSEKNQTIYTTHSPFLVGPDELPLVRVVEMVDRKEGTRVHTNITSQDPGALLPLQEALGYDLAQSLFSQQRNLILEGLTDYWYLEAMSHLLRAASIADLNDKIALVPAQSAGKVAYFATILHAHNLKVAALLDSDAAGDQAAKQDVLVHKLGNKAILRTKDYYSGNVDGPEIEDLLRETLVKVACIEFGRDVSAIAASQLKRPLIDILSGEFKDFSKYRLGKAFLRWSRDNGPDKLAAVEIQQWKSLIEAINRTLK